MRLPHIRCDCCKSLHPVRKVEGGWAYDCDWSLVRDIPAPTHFPLEYREATPASKAVRFGGNVQHAIRQVDRADRRAMNWQHARNELPNADR